MKKILLLTIFGCFQFLFIAQKDVTSANYDFNVRCQGKEMDGSLTLESFGKGRNYSDALEQAKKNAVYAVIFSGIKEGGGGCETDPLLLSSSPQTVHEVYFAEFFKDDGEYLNYVSLKDERILTKVKRQAIKSKTMQQRHVVVRVERLKLKTKLKQDNIN